ncbi:MAG: hypothetical protein JKX70_01115 [Phycisphaerales bacterium]|nr:hypothetical protein [Phycisphaerales bacterium]
MSKEFIQIGVRIVERPLEIKQPKNQPYQPPKQQFYKAIATCQIQGKRLSRTASMETELGAKKEAYSKLATLVAKQGRVPGEGYGLDE